MQDAKEEVRARLNIEDVIGEYVQLKRSGRNFKGLSPFSGEKTPSFYVSPEKHIWHDFSSGRGGDIFGFIMEVEGLDFRQALELLARRAGVDLNLYQDGSSRKLAEKKKRILEALEWAATYYQKSMLSNPRAIEYIFKTRGLNKNVVQDFRIGYAPDKGDALVSFLTKKGFSLQELNDAGLLNRFKSDLFRGRMMVPLMDLGGQVVGFTGRIIDEDPSAPKYLNTPQTLLYDKSRHVFGFSQAKDSIRKGNYAVVVEGNLDVVSSHQAMVSEVVATAGTALTEHHLRALARITSNIKLSFDGDSAGLAATERAIPIAQHVGINLSIITLPEGAKDPDELIQRSASLWQEAIEQSLPVVDWVIDRFAHREDLSTASGKAAFTSAALGVIRNLKDPVEQEHYLSLVAKKGDVSLDALARKLSKVPEEIETRKAVKVPKDPPQEERQLPDKNQDALLAIAIIDPSLHDLFMKTDPLIFNGPERQSVAAYLAKHGGKALSSVPKGLQEHEKYVTMLLLHPDVENVAWNKENRFATASQVLRSIHANYQKKNTKEALLEKERQLRSSGNIIEADNVLRQLSALIKGEK